MDGWVVLGGGDEMRCEESSWRTLFRRIVRTKRQYLIGVGRKLGL